MAISRKASGGPTDATVRQADSSKPALRKGQYDADADQPNEIRTLGLAACISMSSASHSAEISVQCGWPKFSGQQYSPEYSGQLQVDQQASPRAGEDDRQGAPALDWLPMPAPAGIAAHAPHRSPTLTIEQAHPQRGASTVVHLRPLEGEQVQRYVDSYQRLRDDEHAAALWDSERGEFVTMPSRLAGSTVLPAGRSGWIDDGYHEARPAAIDAALASILALSVAG